MKRLYDKIPLVSDWVAFTPTINNGGTTSSNTGWWRRFGDSIQVNAVTTFSGAGAAAGVTYVLPAGLAFDTYRVGAAGSRTIIGVATWYDLSATSQSQFTSQVGGAGQSTIGILHAGTSGLLQGNSLATGDIVSVYACGPISGWSANRRGRG